ncbi:MAG: hypothetical protein ABI895_33350 [Deltaproteobacteria bacterium]
MSKTVEKLTEQDQPDFNGVSSLAANVARALVDEVLDWRDVVLERSLEAAG